MASTSVQVTEAEGLWIKRLYRTETVPPIAAVGEQSPVSPAPSLQPATSFWQSRAMATTVGDHAPCSSCQWELSPTSPAPSLPPAEFGFWQPENLCSSSCEHYDASTESCHSTATGNTKLTSSSTLRSTLSYSSLSSQSVSSNPAAEWPRTRPVEGLLADSLSSKLPAPNVQRRPLGCLLGNSIRPTEAHNSTTASSLRQSSCKREGWPWLGSLNDAPHAPAAAGVLQRTGNHRGHLEGATACLEAGDGINAAAASYSFM